MASAYVVFYHAAISSPSRVIVGRKKQACPNNGGQLTVPGGRINPRESPFAAAKRELWEETRISIDDDEESGHGLVNGQPCEWKGVRLTDCYVLFVSACYEAVLNRLCFEMNRNLGSIPANECEFQQFEVMDKDDALMTFAREHVKGNPKRSTDWFFDSVDLVPEHLSR